MKKKEAIEKLNNSMFSHKYCPFRDNICNSGCISYIAGEVYLRTKTLWDVKYPKCSFFKKEVVDVMDLEGIGI